MLFCGKQAAKRADCHKILIILEVGNSMVVPLPEPRQLHAWQTDCLNRWAEHGYQGIVNAVTGAGKTFLALAAVQRLASVLPQALQVKIVVPQTFLASQWRDEIKRLLGVAGSDIGLYSGKRKDHGKRFMIYIINSARYSLARHILSDIKNGMAVFLIADECHHYGSEENRHIFDFIRLLDGNSPYYTLGLSATPDTLGPSYKTITASLGREIYSYDLSRALQDNIISRFILFNISLAFRDDEKDAYQELSDKLTICLSRLWAVHPELRGLSGSAFFSRLHILAARGTAGSGSSEYAASALQLMYQRRSISHMAKARIPCALSIVRTLPPQTRFLLFCERIQTAEAIYLALQTAYPGQAGLYHSQMADTVRQNTLEHYRAGTFRLLVCCRALDEGFNIPDTDVGVIVASTTSIRQRIQRLGRLLRRSGDIKRIYYLYIRDTMEDGEFINGLDALVEEVPLLMLDYDDPTETFFHEEFEDLRNQVLTYVQSRRDDEQMLQAISRNLDLALLRGDFLLPEAVCRKHIRTSAKDRNYWVSVLYAVLARSGKLV